MFDVGDLPVSTFGNWVGLVKAEWLNGLWNYTYVFFAFFIKIKKKYDITFFELLHTFSRTLQHVVSDVAASNYTSIHV